MRVLVLNAGSSSLKTSVVGEPGDATVSRDELQRPAQTGWSGALGDALGGAGRIEAIGHRVVHGGARHTGAMLISDTVVGELEELRDLAPLHNGPALEVISAAREAFPDLPQVACFDTAFHRTLPNVARTLAVPRRLQAKGVARYGFHGLSYAYVMDALAASVGPQAAQGRLVLAHLGNGASLTAVHRGRSVDTSMAFTPAAGIPMSTRAGDLDPGLVLFLARTERMTAEAFHRMVNHESGLLGVSETSGDVRDLLARESSDSRAAEALALFCYQVKKWIGAFAAALGGIDCMVFTGGIGEHAAPIRERICEGLGFLGIEIDGPRNAAQAPRISPDRGRVDVRIIATDEEIMIAKAVDRLLRSGVREA